ncbi:MAG: SufS family cysteine desulfurase [Candidatus Dependentiae bacterium]|nr:SufS family cysteine desulfurase [Candidatus Dependentiae bacterium]
MKDYKKDFPFFSHNKVAYCDSAATSQKPASVIEAVSHFTEYENAPVHRGIYALSEAATTRFEAVREQLCRFIGAAEPSEIVFTRGATESLNLIVHAWGAGNVKAGDEIVLTELEHHAMLVPWQQFAKRHGAVLKFIPIDAEGKLDYSQLSKLITKKTKVVGVTAGSNVIGVATDLAPIIAQAKAVGAKIIVDAAQMLPRARLDVQKLGCDFLAFSGHKLLGPTGIGAVYIKKELHEQLQPFLTGGSMVFSVDWFDSKWREMPQLLEAGTMPIIEVIGLGAALSYLEQLDFAELARQEAELCRRMIDGIEHVKGLRILGPRDELRREGHLISFVIDGIHPYDIASFLDKFHVAVRAGHHCAQPLHNRLGVAASVRASFYLYNTTADVDAIVEALNKIQKP